MTWRNTTADNFSLQRGDIIGLILFFSFSELMMALQWCRNIISTSSPKWNWISLKWRGLWVFIAVYTTLLYVLHNQDSGVFLIHHYLGSGVFWYTTILATIAMTMNYIEKFSQGVYHIHTSHGCVASKYPLWATNNVYICFQQPQKKNSIKQNKKFTAQVQLRSQFVCYILFKFLFLF